MSSSSHLAHEPVSREPEEQDNDSQEMLNSIVTMLGRRLTVYTSLYQTALAERLGLGMVDVKALELVIEFEPITTGQLSCLAGISSGGTTAVIDRLEATGFVVRDKHPLDRRIVVIRPVREKCVEIERHMRAVAEDVAQIGARYEHEQLSAVHGFLAQCVHALKTEALGMLGDGSTQHEGRRPTTAKKTLA
ncbi:MAG: MarR family transcriptional regulator [Pigmentiphaga sp.]|uniref:MarR family winged helix-turn-helix transcriptional regulator n=1 Tax=Pigmentiphaga sp. TaxID=1977564 RepID=UPI0029A3B300|nr:MarR family transcriptional regulator [Pigmentiphaga sp.]MDX3907729.1 MarR family transcriptional regulator [Pigmentiphaga sp.]